ncbi:MAG TPA: ROK family protein [Candidatus Nanopelagicales bacterium]|nr:ROK family protein [Candidatus Nanopelagicales bacterium]
MTGPTVLALDVGGTKVAAGLVDAAGTVIAVHRAATPPHGDAEAVWAAVTGVLDAAAADGDYTAVGIACGGPMRWPSGHVDPLNIPGWRGFPLLDRVRDRYGQDRPVRIHNDAVALAIGQARWGAGRGVANLLAMVVSTGVGGGLVLGGRRVDGASGNAGHIGHVVVEPDGPACACGGRGCLEAVARGPAIAAAAAARGWSGPATAQAVTAAARDGDERCLAALARAGRAVGVALASTVALLDLELVCIGGGVAQAGDLLLGPVRAAYDEHAGLEYTRRVRIVPVEGADAGLVGAAALVLGDEVPPPATSRYWETDWAADLL